MEGRSKSGAKEKYLMFLCKGHFWFIVISLGLKGWWGPKPRTKKKRGKGAITQMQSQTQFENNVTVALSKVTIWLNPKPTTQSHYIYAEKAP